MSFMSYEDMIFLNSSKILRVIIIAAIVLVCCTFDSKIPKSKILKSALQSDGTNVALLNEASPESCFASLTFGYHHSLGESPHYLMPFLAITLRLATLRIWLLHEKRPSLPSYVYPP